MQLDFIIIHVLVLLGSLWITKLGIKGIMHRRLEIHIRGYERVYLNATAFLLSLAYVIFGTAATFLTIVSFFQTDYRVLQLAVVIMVFWIMTNIVAYWFTQAT